MSKKRYSLPLTLERADILDELYSLTQAFSAGKAILASMRKREDIILSPNWPELELELCQQQSSLEAAIHDCRLRLLGQLPMYDWLPPHTHSR